MVGAEGPLFVTQFFRTALVGYRLTDPLELDLLYSAGGEGSPANAQGTIVSRQGNSVSLQVSYFPWVDHSNGFLKTLFLRSGPALQSIENEKAVAGERTRLWHSKIYGLELGIGGRANLGSRVVVEFIPLTYFVKLSEHVTSGDDPNGPSAIELRIFTWRIGVTF